MYASSTEAAKRQVIFETNCARYTNLNSIPGGATYGTDEWSDLKPDEFSALLGCGTDRAKKAIAVAATATAASTPTEWKSGAIDWRNHNGKSYVTPVKNQGAFGTCWSFGAAENLEGLNVRQGHRLVNISEQEFISCCRECQGSKAETTFSWLANNTGGRPALEASYPYVGKPSTCKAKLAPRAPVHLSSWGRVEDDGTGAPVVDGLHRNGPMGMGVDATCFAGYPLSSPLLR